MIFANFLLMRVFGHKGNQMLDEPTWYISLLQCYTLLHYTSDMNIIAFFNGIVCIAY